MGKRLTSIEQKLKILSKQWDEYEKLETEESTLLKRLSAIEKRKLAIQSKAKPLLHKVMGIAKKL